MGTKKESKGGSGNKEVRGNRGMGTPGAYHIIAVAGPGEDGSCFRYREAAPGSSPAAIPRPAKD